MDRILGLQGLGGLVNDEAEVDSTRSAVCSVQSSGQGRSSCSIACFEEAQLTW